MLIHAFEKPVEEMSLGEARLAYDDAVRNMCYDEICAVEQYPEAREDDGPKVAACKRIWRRIRALA